MTWRLSEATHGNRGDVGEVGSNTGGVDNIIEGEDVDKRRRLHEKGERLANTARGSCDDCVLPAISLCLLESSAPHLACYIPTFISAVFGEVVVEEWYAVFSDGNRLNLEQ